MSVPPSSGGPTSHPIGDVPDTVSGLVKKTRQNRDLPDTLQPMSEHAHTSSPLPPPYVALFREIEALHSADSKVVHADIKTDNILYSMSTKEASTLAAALAIYDLAYKFKNKQH